MRTREKALEAALWMCHSGRLISVQTGPNSHTCCGFRMVPEEGMRWTGVSDATIRTFKLIKHLHLLHQICEILPWVFAKGNEKQKKKAEKDWVMHIMGVNQSNNKREHALCCRILRTWFYKAKLVLSHCLILAHIFLAEKNLNDFRSTRREANNSSLSANSP